VILDEADMAGTLNLARTLDFLLERGASVRLVGDDQQLALRRRRRARRQGEHRPTA
jgi:hypothetical protein